MTIKQVLMNRDDESAQAADELIQEAIEIMNTTEDVEEALDYLGLELDYAEELIQLSGEYNVLS